MGLRLVLADIDEATLAQARKEVAQTAGDANVITVLTDVSKHEDVERLKEKALDAFGEVRVTFMIQLLGSVLTHK
jgi:NAD(P)-dependent dehydrogenase (short-subunit alcohol dehydrogenase family)